MSVIDDRDRAECPVVSGTQRWIGEGVRVPIVVGGIGESVSVADHNAGKGERAAWGGSEVPGGWLV